jgi:cytochrome d ubiquinol oxidase subunit II
METYQVLQVVWFCLWGLLWAVYFLLDGFDFGLGTLLPFLGKTEDDKRVIYNAAGPYWDGNEVWLISAGGVTFAAFPTAYAVMFSALYAPLLILLFTLIFRAVSYEFRSKETLPGWTQCWDIVQFLGNFCPALLFGVAFANLFIGIPIDQHGVYHGSLLGLLSPYGLAGGVLFVLIFALHGALWLCLKSEGNLHTRALAAAIALWPVVLIVTLALLGLTATYTKRYAHYLQYPFLAVAPLLAVAGLLGIRFFLQSGKLLFAWASSGAFIIGVTFFGVLGMFPGIVISSMNPAWSITAFNGSSSQLTLTIMLGVALVFVPIVIGYQFWMYRTFAGPVTRAHLQDEHSY